jgi:hypothetical protein
MLKGGSYAGCNPRVVTEKFIDFNYGEARIEMP